MIKIHHLYVNPQNIKQSYRWKLRCPAMLLMLPSVWTVNTDSYIVENVFSIISGWSTRIQIYCSEKYRMTWDCQLQKEVNQLNARLRSQRVKTGHTESRFALKGSTSSVPLLGQCRIPQRPQREMLSCSDSLKNLSRPRRARPSMCETAFPGIGVLLSSLTALLLQALQVVCEQPHSLQAVLAQGWTLISPFSLLSACASFDGIFFSPY